MDEKTHGAGQQPEKRIVIKGNIKRRQILLLNEHRL
jgi:hypothetical protein